MKSPYPYFGGKSKVADEVWRRFGKCDTYVEPFYRQRDGSIERIRRMKSRLNSFFFSGSRV